MTWGQARVAGSQKRGGGGIMALSPVLWSPAGDGGGQGEKWPIFVLLRKPNGPQSAKRGPQPLCPLGVSVNCEVTVNCEDSNGQR